MTYKPWKSIKTSVTIKTMPVERNEMLKSTTGPEPSVLSIKKRKGAKASAFKLMK